MTAELAEQPVTLELPPRQPLAGRTCLVTGASRGIGRGIAHELGRYGATVVVNYRSSEEAAHEVVDTITEAESEGAAHPIQADVTDRDEIETMREAVHDAFGPTPLSKLRIEGSVDGKDNTDNILILQIDDMVAPTEEPTH